MRIHNEKIDLEIHPSSRIFFEEIFNSTANQDDDTFIKINLDNLVEFKKVIVRSRQFSRSQS